MIIADITMTRKTFPGRMKTMEISIYRRVIRAGNISAGDLSGTFEELLLIEGSRYIGIFHIHRCR